MFLIRQKGTMCVCGVHNATPLSFFLYASYHNIKVVVIVGVRECYPEF